MSTTGNPNACRKQKQIRVLGCGLAFLAVKILLSQNLRLHLDTPIITTHQSSQHTNHHNTPIITTPPLSVGPNVPHEVRMTNTPP
jgi:hypothetical protein